jgi:hypothetical protein
MEDTDREREKGTLYRIRKWSVCGDGLKNNSLPHTQKKEWKTDQPTQQSFPVHQPASQQRERREVARCNKAFIFMTLSW